MSYIDPDPVKGSQGGPSLSLPASDGTKPWSALPLVNGDGFFTIINRGKPSTSDFTDLDNYTSQYVYGMFMSDLVATTVTDPPAVTKVGRGFVVTDTVENQGPGPSRATNTSYFFSATKRRG